MKVKDTLLLFDLDGTLWDSASPVAEAWNEVFQRECPGLPLLTNDDIHSVMGLTMKEIGQTLYADLEIPRRDEIFDICCVYEVEYLHSHCGTLYPDFRATMEALKAEGYQLAVVSNCQRGYIDAFLASSGAGDLFLDYEEWERTGLTKGENIRGNCTFISHYKAEGGEIILSISKDAVVQMYFVDTANAVSLY